MKPGIFLSLNKISGMKNMRIVFMGTPEFAVASLNILVKNNYNIVGVITAPDKPAGRGKLLNQSAIKKYALEHKLNILQPANLKSRPHPAGWLCKRHISGLS